MYKILPILLLAYGLAVTTDDIYDNSYALIIGIDKYENVQNLNYAVKDAESIQDILVNTFAFPKDNVKVLKNEDATKQNIIQAFSDITTKAEDKDRVLIYFAGHGDTDDLPEGGEMGYLLPVDGDNENLFVTSIAMDDLKRISLMSKAKHLLYLIDACYGGIAAIGSRGLDSKTTPNYIDKITKNKSRQIITAGGRGEQVIEKSEWGHSAFTLNLNRGLKDGNADLDGDGYITANELGLFLKKKVTIDSENQQTPQYGRMTSQEGEFVFISKLNNIIIPAHKDLPKDEEKFSYNELVQQLADLKTANEEHNKLSVRPLLDYSFTIDDSSSTNNASAIFIINNDGLGPAVILSREYFVDGKKIDDSMNHFSVKVDSTLHFDNTKGNIFESISTGSTISAGDNLKVFGVYFSNRESFYRQRMKLHDRLSFIIKYESLYGEQYEVSHNIDKIKGN